MFADESCKLTVIDEVFGGHSLTVFRCHDCDTVKYLYLFAHLHHCTYSHSCEVRTL